MEIDKVFTSDVDGVADNLFSAVKNSVSEIKAMQQRKAAENVQLVIQALKKIESDLQDKFDGVTTVIEKRVSTIKDGRDGINGRDGRDGKEGRPGKDGLPGRPGKDGMPGRDGVDGQDGVSVTDARIDFDGSLIIGLSSGREINVGEVVAPDLAERIKVITNGGGTSQGVLDTLASLQAQIDALDGFLDYKGTWNASTNTPTLVSSTGTKGDYYVVSVAGSTNLNGETNWGVGDWVVFNNSTWQKVDGGSTGNLTTAVISSSLTLDYGTANGVLYLNGSKVATSGAALTFNGTNLTTTALTQAGYIYNTTSGNAAARNWATTANDQTFGDFAIRQSTGILLNPISSGRILYYINPNGDSIWSPGGSEQMRLNTTGLGIGNNNPAEKLDVTGNFKLSGSATLSGGTANGVAYLNGSKVVTTGSALTFDGTVLTSTTSAATAGNFKATSSTAQVFNVTASNDANTTIGLGVFGSAASSFGMIAAGQPLLGTAASDLNIYSSNASGVIKFGLGSTPTEQMRLTSKALMVGYTSDSGFSGQYNLGVSGSVGIGTSSPATKLDVNSTAAAVMRLTRNGGTAANTALQYFNGTVSWYAGMSSSGLYSIGYNDAALDSGQVRLDSSGNLGLGVTPSAWESTAKAIQFGSLGYVARGSSGQTMLGFNNYLNTSNQYIYSATSQASRYEQISGEHRFYTAPSGTAGNAITFTQAMTLDASGNLGVGTTSPTNYGGSYINLEVKGGGSVGGVFTSKSGGGSDARFYAIDASAQIGAWSNIPLLFYTNSNERARITSTGYFKASNAGTYISSTGDYHELRSSNDNYLLYAVNTRNGGGGPFGVSVEYSAQDPNGTGNEFLQCVGISTLRAEIRSNGGLANYQSNNVDLSDARTKTDVTPLGSYWNKIAGLEIVNYKYKDQTHDDLNIGVIAQQVEQIAPEFVDAEGFGETPEDGIPLKTVYNKDLTFAAIKALQEAMSRIEALEAQVAKLKGA